MSGNAQRSLLLIEDNPGDARLLREMFSDPMAQGTELVHVQSLGDAESLLSKQEFDLVLLDLGLPDAQGLAAVKRAQAAAPRTPLVVLTGLDDESLAAQALKQGAQDYLIKGQIETRSLLRALRYAVERKLMDDALFEEKERAQVTLGCIGEGVVCADSSGNITFLNSVAERATGWPLAEALGRPMAEVFRTRDSADEKATETTTAVAVLQIRTMRLPPSCFLVRRDGSTMSIEESIAPIHNRGGKPIGAVIVFRDVTLARAMSLQVAHSAEHDFLTGLPNRMLLNDRIDRAILGASRGGRQVAVLFLDLDGFKRINDSLGHSVGDKLLQSVAKRLVKCARGADTVCRQGGDEFIVLLSDVQQAEAAVVMANRILESVAKPHLIGQHELKITTSIGISAYPADGENAEALIKNADTAMYQAKENGRQSFRFFEPAMNARAVERQSIEDSLRRALKRGELILHYQPKICLQSRSIVGAEALMCWAHPTRGPLSSEQFVPVAEECGLILPIGTWALREACTQARAWSDAGHAPISIAVNVSAAEIGHERFLENLFAVLDETRMDPALLELELNESVLLKRVESTAVMLQALRARGVRITLDDFGTGYSSFTYLQKFPIDALKVHRSFVRQITACGDKHSIVMAVIAMARSLNVKVVAEGVETQAELDILQAQLCDHAQGDYFSKPLPLQHFVSLLKRSAPKATSKSPGSMSTSRRDGVSLTPR